MEKLTKKEQAHVRAMLQEFLVQLKLLRALVREQGKPVGMPKKRVKSDA